MSWPTLLARLRAFDGSLAGLPDPAVGSSEWIKFIRADHGRWRRRVGSSFRRLMRQLASAPGCEAVWDQYGLVHCRAQAVEDPDELLSIEQIGLKYPVPCSYCDKRFANKWLLGTYLRFTHKVLPQNRLLAIGTVCMVCSTEFHSWPRLVRHLGRVPASLAAYQAFGRVPACELELAEAADAAARKAERSVGQRRLTADIPAIRL